MITTLTKQDLIDFENMIALLFKAKQIRSIIHLSSGNEDQMLEIFKDIKPEDWVMGSWRMHYQCLLKGVPPEELLAEIMAGKSIHLCFPQYNIMSSGIVGGILPIAVGVAMGIKRQANADLLTPTRKVHCFLGDMTAQTGIARECIDYAQKHNLPIRFIIEDNGFGVCTDTRTVWNVSGILGRLEHEPGDKFMDMVEQNKILYYHYKHTKYPHAGSGERIEF